MDEATRDLFRNAARVQWDTWVQNGAVHVLSLEESKAVQQELERKGEGERILQPCFVLTDKNAAHRTPTNNLPAIIFAGCPCDFDCKNTPRTSQEPWWDFEPKNVPKNGDTWNELKPHTIILSHAKDNLTVTPSKFVSAVIGSLHCHATNSLPASWGLRKPIMTD